MNRIGRTLICMLAILGFAIVWASWCSLNRSPSAKRPWAISDSARGKASPFGRQANVLADEGSSQLTGDHAMEFLFSEIEKALENNLFYAALLMTLTIPDICAALESGKIQVMAEY
jgi:hypothetical protein